MSWFVKSVWKALGFLMLNPIAGLIAVVGGMIIAWLHQEWTVIALFAVGILMILTYVLGDADVKGFSRKK
jgi:hypothetical protein